MATTRVILRKKVENLGAEADVVEVKAGFARNFLIPQAKAYEATKGNLRHLASLQTARTERETAELNTAQTFANKIAKMRPKFTLESGQGGRAFGSVTSMDIHSHLEEKGIKIDRQAIKLSRPIKQSGPTEIEVKLHPQVTATLTINIETVDQGAGDGARS